MLLKKPIARMLTVLAVLMVAALTTVLCWSWGKRSEVPAISQHSNKPSGAHDPASPSRAEAPADTPVASAGNRTTIPERPVGNGALHAYVTDRAGEPVSGATFTLEMRGERGVGGGGIRLEALADSLGEAQFLELPWGNYLISVLHDGLAGSANATIDATRPAQSLEIVLKPAGRIEGIVINGEEAPIAAASVSVLDLMRNKASLQTVTSGNDGRFEFHSLPLGLYRIKTVATGYAPALSPKVAIGGAPITVTLDQGGRVHGVVRDASNRAPVPGIAVRVAASDFRDLSFEAVSITAGEFLFENAPAGLLVLSSATSTHSFEPPETMVKMESGTTAEVELLAALGGRVTGRVYDTTSGAAVAGALVRASNPDFPGQSWISKATDADGRYELAGLAGGLTHVSLVRVPTRYGSGASDLKIEVEVIPGEWVENIDLTVSSGLMVCGVVLDEKGEPVAGATISMAKTEPNADAPYLFESTTSDGMGAFCFTNIVVRMIEVERDVFEPERLALEANFRGARSELLQLPDFSESLSGLELKLLPVAKGAIAGVVVDDTGKPVIASLSLRHPYIETDFDQRLLRSDVDGHFLFQDLSAGDFEIWMAADNGTGYNAGKKLAHSLTLASGQRVTDLRLVLNTTGAVTGVLKDRNGVPMPRIKIEAWDLSIGDYASGAFTDQEGRFNITNLEGTNLELRPADDSTGGYWSVAVAPGDDVEIALTPDMFGGTRPPEPVYVLDPETGEEIVTTEEELPTLLETTAPEELP